MSIIIPIITEYMDGGAKKAQKSLKDLVTSQASLAASVATVTAFAVSSVKAFNEDQKSQKLLALTMRNTTNATKEQIGATEDYLSRLSMQVAIADDELRPALSGLLRITKDQRVAQNLLNDSVDIAAAVGKPLETVTAAVGKAYQGNVGALRKLGLGISDSTLKTKNFQSAMSEIRPIVRGAGEEAANTAEGGFKKLNIAVGEAKESIGGLISNAATPWVRALTDVASATKDSSKSQQLLKTTALKTSQLEPVIKFWGFLTSKLRESQKQADETAKAYANAFSIYDKLIGGPIDALDQIAAAQEEAKRKAKEHQSKLAELAKTAKGNLSSALERARQKVQDLKDEASNLAGTLRDQVTGFVSLSDAVSTASSAEDGYNEALKDRAKAYETLNALEAERKRRGFGPNDQVTYDAEQYAQALIDVASAESAVNDAQSKRTNYSAKFAADISAAKAFAGNLKVLAERGLGQAGIQQLLNIGPVAGNQVALDLINGTGPMTVDTLKNNLAELASAGQGLGDVTAGGVFGTAIAGAQADVANLKNAKVVQQNNNVTIQVTSADPNAVVAALKKWMKSNGSIPIRVNG